jgi:cell filamentation protein
LRRQPLNKRSFRRFDFCEGCRLSTTRALLRPTLGCSVLSIPGLGQDRFVTAPQIAIVKAGYKTLFAHPADVQRASEHALHLGTDPAYLRVHPGEVFGYLAHAHPFLERNGRTILTVFAELSRRAGFHVEWEAMDKDEFLETLTRELLWPVKSIMDQLVLPYSKEGVLSVDKTASRLRVNFKRDQAAPSPGPEE